MPARCSSTATGRGCAGFAWRSAMPARPGWSPPTAASVRSCWWCGRRSGGCRPASAPWWSCATRGPSRAGGRPAAPDAGRHRQVDRQPGAGPAPQRPGGPPGRPRRHPEGAAVNLEELVQAALTTQASAEPEEAGAYDRFLRHRRRRAWRAAGSAGLAVALVLALAVGGAWLAGGRHQESLTGPVDSTGTIRYPAQGFALTLP